MPSGQNYMEKFGWPAPHNKVFDLWHQASCLRDKEDMEEKQILIYQYED